MNQPDPNDVRRAIAEFAEAARRLTGAMAQMSSTPASPPPAGPGEAANESDGSFSLTPLVLTPDQKRICERVLNVFETGSVRGRYGAITIFADGPDNIRQITYGRSQTTEYGKLRQLVQMYVAAGGMFSEDLREFAPIIGFTALVDNERFKDLLRRAGNEDQVMRDTQDTFFDTAYFNPAMRWAGDNGFTHGLSALVIYDSYIHSGSIRDDLRSRFPELPPARGGNERVWIRQYVGVRHEWLRTHPRPIVRATIYRTRDLAREIARGNWDLDMLPIMANGTPVDAGGSAITGAFDEGDIPYIPVGDSDAAMESSGGEIWGDDTFAASGAASAGPADVPGLANAILADPDIKLATVHASGFVDHANARQNIVDTAAGNNAKRSSYGTAPGGSVPLDPRLLRGLLALAQEYSFSISEIAGGSHSANSRHYVGVAADINKVNGQPVNASHLDLAAFKARCRDLGATEVLGPGAPHHDTHVHAAWPRP
jgi:chitosanase